MPNKKISALNSLGLLSGDYVFPVVDVDNTETKKVSFQDLLENVLPVLPVAASNITGNTKETPAPSLGITSDNKLCFLRPGGGTGDWENVLVSESGDFVSNIQLANAGGTVLEENVLGHVDGKLVVGDGATVAEELGSNTNSDLMQTFFYTGGILSITSGSSNELQRIPVPCSYQMLGDFPTINAGAATQDLSNMFYMEADFTFFNSFGLDLAVFMQPKITISPSGTNTYGQFTHSARFINSSADPRVNNSIYNPFHFNNEGDNNMAGYLVPSRTGSDNGPDALFDTDVTLTGFGPYSTSPSQHDYLFSPSSSTKHFSDTSAVTVLSITGEQQDGSSTYDVTFRGIYKASTNFTKVIRKQKFDIDFYFCNATRHAFTGIANDTMGVSNAVIKIFPIA